MLSICFFVCFTMQSCNPSFTVHLCSVTVKAYTILFWMYNPKLNLTSQLPLAYK